MDQALSDIPWAVYDVALSPQRAKERCIMAGIPAPDSFSEDSEDCVAWENKYGEQYPFVSAMRKFRKANTLLEKINAIERRVMPSGRLRYDLKYFGAHTGRWSGSGGVNLQNLPREAFEGIDLRSLFIPAPGKKFIIADLSQIEPRMLAYLAGDLQTLDALKQGYSIYEAHAKTSNLWASEKGTLKKTNPGLYAMCKSRVLGLGYGLGSHRFRGVAKAMAGVDLSEFQAKQAVNNFRCTNPLIPRLWQRLDGALNAGLGIGRFTMTMPSGRQMRYEGLHRRGDGQIYFRQPNGMEVTTWGGKLTENLVSGTARDVFAEGILRLDTAGINVVLHIHDEVVCEVDRDVKKQDVLELLSITPQWLEGCPVAAEAIESDRYLK
jgi:DNA polymerase